MGRYMTVVLKEEHKNDLFIETLNQELLATFGSNNSVKFNPWNFLQEEADYINNTEDGKKQLEGWPRPITKEALHQNFFWLRNGEFSFKLSGGPTSAEARDAIAICKWLIKTRYKYINKSKSDNYSSGIVRQYLDYLFEEAGYDMKALWKIPV
jgi:hypothetical protein